MDKARIEQAKRELQQEKVELQRLRKEGRTAGEGLKK